MRTTLLLIPGLLFALAGIGAAQSPNTDRSFRDGANHHLGDTAFIAEYGRPPTEHEEKLRIRTHFLAVKALLASRPATKPELAANRAKLLAHFDDYIAKGTTPKNDHLPWRTPVFIDDEHTICAVGYLIEQSAGRDVAEKIAATHRYSYLEEIVKAMPEIETWVESSGFTLEELASIQPGYNGPDVAHEAAWTLAQTEDGAYNKDGTNGTIRHHHMVGAWTVNDAAGHLIGTGGFDQGNATWHSSYADGKKLAEGNYVRDQPSGTWRFFHESGNLAAEGELFHGARDGVWHFFYDTAAKTPLATGRFDRGFTIGTWKHFDFEGKLLAVSTASAADGQFLLDVLPGRDGVEHQISQQGFTGDHHRFDMMTLGGEHLYVQEGVDAIYDKRGNRLVHEGNAWTATDCGWNAKRKRAASNGNITRLHDLLMHDRFDDSVVCSGKSVSLSAARSKQVDTMLASVRAVRAQSPDFMRQGRTGRRDCCRRGRPRGG